MLQTRSMFSKAGYYVSLHTNITCLRKADVWVHRTGAIYDFPDTAQSVTESMLPGTIAGEMTFLAGSRRNATVVAERDCVLWRMDLAQLADLEVKEGPFVARAFRQMLLRISAESADGKSKMLFLSGNALIFGSAHSTHVSSPHGLIRRIANTRCSAYTPCIIHSRAL